jgi:hypothetical protein
MRTGLVLRVIFRPKMVQFRPGPIGRANLEFKNTQ